MAGHNCDISSVFRACLLFPWHLVLANPLGRGIIKCSLCLYTLNPESTCQVHKVQLAAQVLVPLGSVRPLAQLHVQGEQGVAAAAGLVQVVGCCRSQGIAFLQSSAHLSHRLHLPRPASCWLTHMHLIWGYLMRLQCGNSARFFGVVVLMRVACASPMQMAQLYDLNLRHDGMRTSQQEQTCG